MWRLAQHKHMYSLYIGNMCNIAFSMTTCIVTSRVRENLNAMKLSIELCIL